MGTLVAWLVAVVAGSGVALVGSLWFAQALDARRGAAVWRVATEARVTYCPACVTAARWNGDAVATVAGVPDLCSIHAARLAALDLGPASRGQVCASLAQRLLDSRRAREAARARCTCAEAMAGALSPGMSDSSQCPVHGHWRQS